MKKVFFILFLLIYYFGCLAQQTSEIVDSLTLELEKVRTTGNNADEEGRILLYLSYYTQNTPNKVKQYAQECLSIADSTGNKNIEAQALTYLAIAESGLGNNIKAIEYYLEAANLFKANNLPHYEAHAFSSIASTYSNIGDKKNTLFYSKQALQIFDTFHDTLYAASTIGNLGEFYRKYGNLDSAIYYFNSAINDLDAIKSIEKLERAKHIKETNIGNLGMSYLEKGDNQKAMPFLQEATDYFMEQSDTYRASVYQSEIGKILIKEGKQRLGEALIKESLQMAHRENLKEQIRDFNQQLADFYEEQKNYPKALYHYQQFKTYDDSLKNVENVRKMEQLQSDFQLSRKDKEIANLNKVNQLQRRIGLLLMLGVIFVMVMIYILYMANRRIKTFNKEIIQQKEIIEQREAEKALLLRELNHRVKNNLQMVASLLSLHSRQLKGHPAAEALMAGKYRVEALTLIHQKLYRDDVDTKIDIKDYIEELVQNLVMNFGQNFKLELYLLPFVMKIDKAIPLGLILNELITNSLKYGQKNNDAPLLSVSITQKEDEFIIKIQDNGEGLSEDFDFRNSKSFGLKLVHSLIGQLKGTINWDSAKGTCWTITLNSKTLN